MLAEGGIVGIIFPLLCFFLQLQHRFVVFGPIRHRSWQLCSASGHRLFLAGRFMPADIVAELPPDEFRQTTRSGDANATVLA